jgi:hypothetical protein
MRLDSAIDNFGELTKDNPRQQARVPMLEGLEAQVLLRSARSPKPNLARVSGLKTRSTCSTS